MDEMIAKNMYKTTACDKTYTVTKKLFSNSLPCSNGDTSMVKLAYSNLILLQFQN